MDDASIGLSVGFTSILLLLLYLIFKQWTRCPVKRAPPNVVCLYQVGRGPWAPSISPFPLKLETLLRMAKIPYMNNHTGKMSTKGKTPWITYNGLDVADSQFCIEFLKQERGLDFDAHLTKEEKAVARAFRELTEENMYWTMCYETFIKTPQSLDILLQDIFPRYKTFLFKRLMGRIIKQELHGQGIGRHTDSEIWDIGRRDLTALSEFLGSKQFFFGDSPCEADCAIFGMLAMAVWQMKGSRHERLIYEKLPNLVSYCERMKNRFWPDWAQRCRGKDYVPDDNLVYTLNQPGHLDQRISLELAKQAT